MAPAYVSQFGDNFRPTPLKKMVRGFDSANAWALQPHLDKALFPLLQEDFQVEGKPVMVFCPTRKSESTRD
jgi:hypothetical protein